MAKGPRGEKRPEDPAQAAVAAVRIALGEIPEQLDEIATNHHGCAITPKNPAAVALGKLGGQKGGKARADKLTAQKRSEIARWAATARWKRNDE